MNAFNTSYSLLLWLNTTHNTQTDTTNKQYDQQQLINDGEQGKIVPNEAMLVQPFFGERTKGATAPTGVQPFVEKLVHNFSEDFVFQPPVEGELNGLSKAKEIVESQNLESKPDTPNKPTTYEYNLVDSKHFIDQNFVRPTRQTIMDPEQNNLEYPMLPITPKHLELKINLIEGYNHPLESGSTKSRDHKNRLIMAGSQIHYTYETMQQPILEGLKKLKESENRNFKDISGEENILMSTGSRFEPVIDYSKYYYSKNKDGKARNKSYKNDDDGKIKRNRKRTRQHAIFPRHPLYNPLLPEKFGSSTGNEDQAYIFATASFPFGQKLKPRKAKALNTPAKLLKTSDGYQVFNSNGKTESENEQINKDTKDANEDEKKYDEAKYDKEINQHEQFFGLKDAKDEGFEVDHSGEDSSEEGKSKRLSASYYKARLPGQPAAEGEYWDREKWVLAPPPLYVARTQLSPQEIKEGNYYKVSLTLLF